MTTNSFASVCSGIPHEALTHLFDLSDVTLPFWDCRKPMPMYKIVRLEGEGNYTVFHFSDGTRLMVSLTLKKMAARLAPDVFVRTHKKNIVNLLYLAKTHHDHHQHTVQLTNGDLIDVSRRKASCFFRQVEGFQQRVQTLAA